MLDIKVNDPIHLSDCTLIIKYEIVCGSPWYQLYRIDGNNNTSVVCQAPSEFGIIKNTDKYIETYIDTYIENYRQEPSDDLNFDPFITEEEIL